MRALLVSVDSTASTASTYPLFFQSPPTAATFISCRFLSLNCNNSSQPFSPCWKSVFSLHGPYTRCSTTNTSVLETNEDDDGGGDFDDNDDDYSSNFLLVDEKRESFSGEGVFLEIKKLGRNSRRIRSKIGIDSSLNTVWSILTDYEKLADFIPGLAVSQLVEKNGNCSRVFQIGQQNLALGMKFKAKGVLDCYEKDLEILPSGQRREIEFKMVEGDFELFEGKWSIEEFNCEGHEGALGEEFRTTLSYLVDVKPKMWLPIRLVEGRLSNEIKTNLSCIKEKARQVIRNTLGSI